MLFRSRPKLVTSNERTAKVDRTLSIVRFLQPDRYSFFLLSIFTIDSNFSSCVVVNFYLSTRASVILTESDFNYNRGYIEIQRAYLRLM